MTVPSGDSPIPPGVAVELRRMVERWQQLPLDHALSRSPAVCEAVQRLADRAAVAGGHPDGAPPVPDLGPAVLMDQLTVVVHDVCALSPRREDADVAALLTGIRHAVG
ncbi:hypothetical protein DFJ68_1872 [Terracoccus luteus]|uniref:Uncharacterized protein n=1 Tax=Terracoccus luteus TaxID=53356 RepID=A0A495XVY0_9MICO|nr:hypothetical protein [Terracoccus luteus]RKT78427.1 hypothetical protein DFJ68_1872 [Terracoccus luteus]